MMLPYSEKVMDHLMHPRNVGEIENPDGVGRVGNPVCGDVMALYIKVEMALLRTQNLKPSGVVRLSLQVQWLQN